MKYDFSTNEYVLNRVDGSEYRWDDLFPGIVQNFWINDPTVWDLENKVTWDEIAPSLQELIIRKIRFSDLHDSLQNRIITDENNITVNTNAINNEIVTRRAQDKILQDQVDSLKRRMTAAEKRITDLELRMDEAERQINLLWEQIRLLWEKMGDTEDRVSALEDKLGEVEDELEKVKELVKKNSKIVLVDTAFRYSQGNRVPSVPGEFEITVIVEAQSAEENNVHIMITQKLYFCHDASSGNFDFQWPATFFPVFSTDTAVDTGTMGVDKTVLVSASSLNSPSSIQIYDAKSGYGGNPWGMPRGQIVYNAHANYNGAGGPIAVMDIELSGDNIINGFDANDNWPITDWGAACAKLSTMVANGWFVTDPASWFNQWFQ